MYKKRYSGFKKKATGTELKKDRLISALNKYWRPITEKEYEEEMTVPDTQNAIKVASFPKEVGEWIWEKKKTDFEVYK